MSSWRGLNRTPSAVVRKGASIPVFRCPAILIATKIAGIAFWLPDVNCLYRRRAAVTVYDFYFEHDLDISRFPAFGVMLVQ
jgi:hypothetical protein